MIKKNKNLYSALFFVGLSLTVISVMPITVINNTSAVIRVVPSMTILPREESFGGMLGGLIGGVIGGVIGNTLRKRAEAQQRLYEHELQLATQERLMKIVHQQKLKEMAYQQELEVQKRAISITHTTNEIGILASFVVIFFIMALFGAIFIIRRKKINS
jgi:hypothetical protein